MNIHDIQNMSDDEVAALNAELSKQVAKKFATIFAVKLGLALAVHYAVKKL